MNNLQKEAQEWAHKTFGYSGTSSVVASLNHLLDEVNELIEAVKSGDITSISEEFADCQILLLHTSLSCGLTFSDVVRATRLKLEVNKTRRWGAPDERGVVKHIK